MRMFASAYHAGNIKATTPIAFTTTLLVWGLMAFGKGFEASTPSDRGVALGVAHCLPQPLQSWLSNGCCVHALLVYADSCQLPTMRPLQAAGQAGAALDSIRWGSDYLLKVGRQLACLQPHCCVHLCRQ